MQNMYNMVAILNKIFWFFATACHMVHLDLRTSYYVKKMVADIKRGVKYSTLRIWTISY